MSPDQESQVESSIGLARRVVVKVGSAVLAQRGVLEPARVARLATDIGAALSEDARRQIVLVSSGAVASGFRALGLARPPKIIADKQAAAAVGQPRLMAAYGAAFGGLQPARTVAQVLLTADDIDHRARFLNARHTLERLLQSGVIPIINENDSVSFSEIKLGDNDRLSSLVASLVNADALIILSSVAGVWGAHPMREAARQPEIVPIIRSLREGLALVAPTKSETGTGGMGTKIGAACQAASLGIGVVIADGGEPGVVRRLLSGERLGTHFPPVARSHAARRRWIGFAARPKGTLMVDDGARRAVVSRGASLLPGGISGVKGEFAVGALVELQVERGAPFARGLVSYASADINRIKGKKGSEIEGVLGFRYADEVIHRDDLVLLNDLESS